MHSAEMAQVRQLASTKTDPSLGRSNFRRDSEMLAITNLDGGIHRGNIPGVWKVEKRRPGFDTSCSISSEKVCRVITLVLAPATTLLTGSGRTMHKVNMKRLVADFFRFDKDLECLSGLFLGIILFDCSPVVGNVKRYRAGFVVFMNE